MRGVETPLSVPQSPMSSTTTTPSNSTPVSPSLHQTHLQSRQLRPPKTPLYVPAVLRPTERPSKPSPPTPPRSLHGPSDNLEGPEQPSLTRRSTVDSSHSEVSKLAEDEWLRAQNLGEITGLPKRDHWKADAASPSCDSPVCKSSFGIFLRRHHCRHCGHVFCSSHSPHTVRLDQNARFHPDGVLSRACDLCWQAYRRWDEERANRLNQIERHLHTHLEEHRGRGEDASKTLPLAASGLAQSRPINGTSLSAEPPSEIVASSVPRDWSWSTF